MKKLLLLSLVVYSVIAIVTLCLGNLFLIATAIAVAGIAYDVNAYLRLKNGKSIITLKSVIRKINNIQI